MLQTKQGFKGQRLIAISSEILLNIELNPTDIGYTEFKKTCSTLPLGTAEL